MKHLFLSLLILMLTAGSLLPASANHIVGTQLVYQEVPGLPNYYLITMKFYRDCSSTTPVASPVLKVTSSCGTLPDLTLTLNQITDVSEVCAAAVTNCSAGSPSTAVPGREEYIFTQLIGMGQAPPCSDWTFSYSNCCRSTGILNLPNVGGSPPGFYAEAVLNSGTAAALLTNTNPFEAPVRVFACLGDTLTFNFGTFDPDGDSLVYSLAPALGGTAPNPVPLAYTAGYSATQPFGSTGTLSFNTQTGELKAIANQLGSFVVVLKIEEYRNLNGIITKMGSSQRDLQFQVVNCSSQPLPYGYTLNINNGSATANSAAVIATLPNQLLQIGFPVSSPGPGIQLAMAMDMNAAFDATFTATGSGNQITGLFEWTPDLSDVRPETYDFPYRITDNACPYPRERSGVLRILVTNNLSSGDPTVSATGLSLPSVLHPGELLVLPEVLKGNRLRVFAPEGKLVFEASSYHNTWQAPQLASGIYVYQVSPAGGKPPYSARLLISR